MEVSGGKVPLIFGFIVRSEAGTPSRISKSSPPPISSQRLWNTPAEGAANRAILRPLSISHFYRLIPTSKQMAPQAVSHIDSLGKCENDMCRICLIHLCDGRFCGVNSVLQHRSSDCARQSSQRYLERLRGMTIEERVLLALDLKQSFSWLNTSLETIEDDQRRKQASSR